MLVVILTLVALSSVTVFGQDCVPKDFGSDSIVCLCNSTYCDYYPVPEPPKKGEYIWYISSKGGKRLNRSDGKIETEPRGGVKVKVNSKKQFQTMEGFGGAFTDAAGINIKKLSQGSQDNLLRSYFGKDGSKYNFGRVPIGGSDFSRRAYSLDDSPNDTLLRNFSLANEDFEYKIPLMKKALELNPSLRFLAASWTAPPWMKSADSFNKFGSYLKDEYYQTYADYTVKFLEEYKKNGLVIWAVSTGNEPLSAVNPFTKINSMLWTVDGVSKWVVNNLGPTIQKSNSNETTILLIDDQRINLPWFIISVKGSHKEVLNYAKGIAIHWYLDDIVPASVIDYTHSLVPDKFILMTEACIGDRPWDNPKVILGSWHRADRLLKKMFENINHWVAGWVDWNLALDKEGGPNWVKNYVDAPIIVEPEYDVFYKQPMYYAMTHFSKFVPRSSIKIDISSGSSILSTAFKTTDNQIVVILYNTSSRKKSVSIVDDQVGSINIELPEYSLHTILYKASKKLI